MDFYQGLDEGAKDKIDYVLDMLKTQDKVHIKFVKHIRDGVYEIRAE